MKKIKVAMWGNSTGTKWWRLIHPAAFLNRNGFEAKVIEDSGIKKEVVEWADICVISNVVDKEGIAILYEYQQEYGKKIIADFDDFIHLNDDSPFKMEHKIYQWAEVAQVVAKMADMLTVTQPFLVEKFKDLNSNIKILPNYMDLEKWDIQPKLRNDSDTLRIGWAGSMTPMDDLKSIIPPLRRICKEFPKVKLIFCGETRIADFMEGMPIEVVLGNTVESWPARLRGLRYDIGMAPLTDTEFNRGKSNIKWQEYAINEIPGVFSPVVYPSVVKDGINGFLAKDEEEWYQKLKALIISPELREKIGKAAYEEAVRDFSLEKNIDLWVDSYREILTSPLKRLE